MKFRTQRATYYAICVTLYVHLCVIDIFVCFVHRSNRYFVKLVVDEDAINDRNL